MLFMILLAQAGFAAMTPGQTYSECLLAVSSSLEPSGETPSAIAEATTTACIKLEVQPTADNRLGSMTPDDQQRVLSSIREAFQKRVALKVIRERACRRTVGCSIKSLPKPF